jgi:ABC-type spermidine/putrescine transport system permease subunit II
MGSSEVASPPVTVPRLSFVARLRRRAGMTLLAVAALPIFVFLLLPTVIVAPMSVTPKSQIVFPPGGFSIHAYRSLVQEESWREATLTSLKVASIAIVIGTLVGGTAAIALHGTRFFGKSIVVGICLAPIVAPVIVLALADFQLFASWHILGTVRAIGLAHSVLAAPFVYLTVSASLAGLNPDLVRSAASLGAGPLSLLRHVYLPAISPGLLAGMVFAFAVSFDETVIALFLQGPDATTLPVKMFAAIQYELSPEIAAMSTLLVAISTIVFLVQGLVVLQRRSAARALPGGAAT